jgi:hypothetical protein
MTRPFDETDYERWAKTGALSTLPRDFDSETLRMAGDGLRILKARADSVVGLKSNFSTSERVQSSYKPGTWHCLHLNKIECEDAYKRCLGTLRERERELVVAMVIDGRPASEIAEKYVREMNARAVEVAIRHELCLALKELAKAVKQVMGSAWEDVAQKSQSQSRRRA